MRYKIPVICSNVTSLPDMINSNEFVFDPRNPDKIADMIEKGIKDEDFRIRNIENSKQRNSYYENKDYISEFIKMYKCAIGDFHPD